MVTSEIMLLIAGCVGAVVVGVVTKVLADDAKSFVPRLAQNLLRRASLRLGEDYAVSFYEEWSAHLIEIPETSGKLWHAATIYFWGAHRIRQSLYPATGALVSKKMFKRIFDLALGIMIAPAIFTTMLPLAVLIALHGKSPFYSQMCVGQHGRTFRVWKLRTFFDDSDQHLASYLEQNVGARVEWELSQKLKSNPRLTKVGGFLRKSSLDELPQWWNVMNGTMSFVGPRLLVAEQKNLCDGKAYCQMRPGITGLWQISPPLNCTFKCRERLDDEYLKQQSLLTDIKIVFNTAIAVFRPPK